jgi:hypothetical protein
MPSGYPKPIALAGADAQDQAGHGERDDGQP